MDLLPDARPADQTDEILHARHGAVARLVLNRPTALNALTLPMLQAISQLLDTWAADDTVQTVTVEGAGERGLCAGGDVVAARREHQQGDDHLSFFRAEYDLDAQFAGYPKPVVAFMDGIVMGGGLGISGFVQHRLVTERSMIAMPETIIGFFPDVGSMYLLSRAPGEFGTYLALTGQSVTGADAVMLGLADAQILSADWPTIVDSLADGGPVPPIGDPSPSAPLAAEQHWIDACFSGDDAVQILHRLEAHASEQAHEAAATIRSRSPLSVAVSLEALRRAATMGSVEEVLDQDLRLADHLVQQGDFSEGVRAQLVDKDRSPQWAHARQEDVTRAEVDAAFG